MNKKMLINKDYRICHPETDQEVLCIGVLENIRTVTKWIKQIFRGLKK